MQCLNGKQKSKLCLLALKIVAFMDRSWKPSVHAHRFQTHWQHQFAWCSVLSIGFFHILANRDVLCHRSPSRQLWTETNDQHLNERHVQVLNVPLGFGDDEPKLSIDHDFTDCLVRVERVVSGIPSVPWAKNAAVTAAASNQDAQW